jgi:hypothetical protein
MLLLADRHKMDMIKPIGVSKSFGDMHLKMISWHRNEYGIEYLPHCTYSVIFVRTVSDPVN